MQSGTIPLGWGHRPVGVCRKSSQRLIKYSAADWRDRLFSEDLFSIRRLIGVAVAPSWPHISTARSFTDLSAGPAFSCA
jgi:hypothetical protein